MSAIKYLFQRLELIFTNFQVPYFTITIALSIIMNTVWGEKLVFVVDYFNVIEWHSSTDIIGRAGQWWGNVVYTFVTSLLIEQRQSFILNMDMNLKFKP